MIKDDSFTTIFQSTFYLSLAIPTLPNQLTKVSSEQWIPLSKILVEIRNILFSVAQRNDIFDIEPLKAWIKFLHFR